MEAPLDNSNFWEDLSSVQGLQGVTVKSAQLYAALLVQMYTVRCYTLYFSYIKVAKSEIPLYIEVGQIVWYTLSIMPFLLRSSESGRHADLNLYNWEEFQIRHKPILAKIEVIEISKKHFVSPNFQNPWSYSLNWQMSIWEYEIAKGDLNGTTNQYDQNFTPK